MRTHCVHSFFILVAFPVAAGTHAAQPSTRLPPVVVQGAALPAPNPLDNADITRMTAQDLEQRQTVTLADALRSVPGAYVTQSGGIGQEARVSLRGAGAANTMLVVNGMTINDAGSFDEAVNLSRWLVDDIAEIQVIRGPMGSLYGPGGMGGVVVMETKKGQGPLKVVAKAEGGTFHTVSQMVGIQGEKGLMDYHVMGARVQSAGTPTTPDRFLSQIQGKPNNPFSQENVTARFGVGPGSAHISFFSRYLTGRLKRRPDPVALYPWRQNFSEGFNRLQGHFEGVTGRWEHDIGLGYYQNDLTDTHPTRGNVVRNASQAQIDWRYLYDVTDCLRVSVATDYSQERLHWHTALIPKMDILASHGGLGGTVSYRVDENLMVTGSTRVDKYQGIPSTLTYRLGGQRSFGKMMVKGGMGTAFKAPTVQQRFYQSPSYSGNPSLKPERNFGWDIGMEYPFYQNRLVLGITLFQNRIRDLITIPPGGNSLVNVNKSRTQGVEGVARFHLTPDWALEFSHTYTQAWDEKTGKELVGNPRNKMVFSIVGQATADWQISGNILYIGPRDTFDAVTFIRVKTPSYTIVGAETAYQLTDQWQFYGRGENLLNRSYETPQSVQQPGIGLYAGVRARW